MLEFTASCSPNLRVGVALMRLVSASSKLILADVIRVRAAHLHG
jgi:hypothetical protein